MKEEIVLYVVKKAIEEFKYDKIDRLQVVKILYLIDKHIKEKEGEKLSDFDYILERLGPYSKEIIVSLTSLEREGAIKNLDTYYEYSIGEISKNRKKELEEVEKKISSLGIQKEIKSIFELADNLSNLMKIVHDLKEVKNGEKGDNLL